MHTIRELLGTGSRVHPGAGHRLIRGAHTRFVFGASMLLLAGLLGAAPALAADWYTSPSGSDGSSCSSALAPCLTIQAAINKAAAGDTIHVGVGNYPFDNASGHAGTGVHVNKSVKIIGDGDALGAVVANRAVLQQRSSGNSGRMIFVNGVNNVRIENLQIEVYHSRTNEGILAFGATNGLVIVGNRLTVTSGGTSSKYNAISINPQSSGDRSFPTSGSATYNQLSTVTNNLIEVTGSAPGARGMLIEDGGTTVNGNSIAGGSTDDLRVRWNGGGSILIEGNSFGGRGVKVVEPNVGVTVRNNTFSTQATAVDSSTDTVDLFQLRLDQAPNALIVGNSFTGYGNYFRAVYVERSSGVKFHDNVFTPKSSGSIGDSLAVLVENKSANTNSPPSGPTVLSATFLRNTFNGSGVANRGYAVGLLNSNDPNGNTATFWRHHLRQR